ncbi:B-block_TFIIIC domain-containing protein [Haematococcus lacustris]|uniref:B-block_TFIIIC domain-containing protein n=1 Tax=Haematococcus lacustris TaxID=44745 RepID=A0A699YEM0_HAELA|nr:B-block_TFIIIC domain-containing protein [Haematococcus lacustris]
MPITKAGQQVATQAQPPPVDNEIVPCMWEWVMGEWVCAWVSMHSLWVHDCEDGPCASMDDLVESALQEIALEGRDGCSAGRIWSLLNSRLPISNIQQLSDGVKQLVWVGLLHRWPADILLYTPATQPGPSRYECPRCSCRCCAPLLDFLLVSCSVVPPGKKGGKPRKKPEPVETVKDYKDPSAAPTYQQAEAQQLFITAVAHQAVVSSLSALACLDLVYDEVEEPARQGVGGVCMHMHEAVLSRRTEGCSPRVSDHTRRAAVYTYTSAATRPLGHCPKAMRWLLCELATSSAAVSGAAGTSGASSCQQHTHDGCIACSSGARPTLACQSTNQLSNKGQLAALAQPCCSRPLSSQRVMQYGAMSLGCTMRSTAAFKSIRALEAVGRARSVGVLQAQLASQMDITNSNFFYVVKQMEARGLVVRTPVMVNYSRGQSHMVTTNVLHLKQYAPPVRLGPYQVFKVVDTDGSHAALDADTADDMRLVRLVTERIAATEDKVVLEGELKVVLGFTGKRGHRTWRRLKLKMVKDGYIGVHVADMNGKAVVCLKLLKEVKATPLEGEEEEEEQGVAADPGESVQHPSWPPRSSTRPGGLELQTECINMCQFAS